MRLVHAVLLPGIVVFVAKVNLLQARALRVDVADAPPGGRRHTDVEAIADNESRMRSFDISTILGNIEHYFTLAGMRKKKIDEFLYSLMKKLETSETVDEHLDEINAQKQGLRLTAKDLTLSLDRLYEKHSIRDGR